MGSGLDYPEDSRHPESQIFLRQQAHDLVSCAGKICKNHNCFICKQSIQKLHFGEFPFGSPCQFVDVTISTLSESLLANIDCYESARDVDHFDLTEKQQHVSEELQLLREQRRAKEDMGQKWQSKEMEQLQHLQELKCLKELAQLYLDRGQSDQRREQLTLIKSAVDSLISPLLQQAGLPLHEVKQENNDIQYRLHHLILDIEASDNYRDVFKSLTAVQVSSIVQNINRLQLEGKPANAREAKLLRIEQQLSDLMMKDETMKLIKQQGSVHDWFDNN